MAANRRYGGRNLIQGEDAAPDGVLTLRVADTLPADQAAEATLGWRKADFAGASC